MFVSAFECADFFPDVNLFINHSALTYPHHQHVMHKPVLALFLCLLTFIQKLQPTSFYLSIQSFSVITSN